MIGRLNVGLLLVVLTALAAGACSGNPGLESPVRQVEGTRYYTVDRSAPVSGDPQFTHKLAWLGAASALSRAVATEVYSRLTRTDSLQVEELLKRRSSRARGDIEGTIDFVDEATSRVPLREIHELRYAVEQGEARITLGIPMPTYGEIRDAKLELMEERLQGGAIDLEASGSRGGRPE